MGRSCAPSRSLGPLNDPTMPDSDTDHTIAFRQSFDAHDTGFAPRAAAPHQRQTARGQSQRATTPDRSDEGVGVPLCEPSGMDPHRLDEDEVLLIRRRLASTTVAQRAFGTEVPLYPDRLSSAVARQSTGIGNHMKYTTVPQIAATLFYGLCLGHAFDNGNKRTALVSMLVLLERNGVLLVDTTEDRPIRACHGCGISQLHRRTGRR